MKLTTHEKKMLEAIRSDEGEDYPPVPTVYERRLADVMTLDEAGEAISGLCDKRLIDIDSEGQKVIVTGLGRIALGG